MLIYFCISILLWKASHVQASPCNFQVSHRLLEHPPLSHYLIFLLDTCPSMMMQNPQYLKNQNNLKTRAMIQMQLHYLGQFQSLWITSLRTWIVGSSQVISPRNRMGGLHPL